MPRTDLETLVIHLLQANPQWYQHDGILPIDTSSGQKVAPDVHIHRLHNIGPAEDDEAADGVPTFLEWELPAKEFEGAWESLIYDTNIKERLVRHAAASLHFACAGVDSNIISWNKVALLHGPPGTGKTSLCKALAQKLAIRHSRRYKHGHLIEVNAHSLFSKFFSESGKLVTQLFQKIQEFVDDDSALVFVLVDEVESLTSARKSALGSEPSDAIRSVNALLTHLDALRAHPNVFVLCTSNLPDAVDIAFVDRADIKAYIGLPSEAARYKILRSCITELVRSELVHSGASQIIPPPYPAAVAACEALPDLFSRLCGPGNSPDATTSAENPSNNGLNGAAVGHKAAQELADLQLGDLRLDVDMRDELAVCPEAAPEHGRDSLALVKLGMQLRAVACKCEGLSGRTLRKMPFLAFTLSDALGTPTVSEFVDLLHRTAAQEASDRAALKSG